MFGGLRLTILAVLAAMLALPAMPATLRAHPADALVGGAQAGPVEVRIAGLLDGRRDRVKLNGVMVTINGSAAELAHDGHFAASVPIAPYYRVDITGDRIFDMVQTFGNAEIRDSSCDCLSIPAIELVARKKGRIELFFGGDSMAGRRFFEPRKGERVLLRQSSLDADLDALLAPVKPYIESADLASINLETVLADFAPGPPLENKRITFFSPKAYAKALKRAGVDFVTLGNNHIYDYGEAGVASTIAAIEAAGLAHSGAGHNAEEAERPANIDFDKNPLSLLGFVGWEGSGGAHQVATPEKGGAALATRGKIRRSVQAVSKAKRIPVIQYHGGAEYIGRPSATTTGRLREAVDQGAPLAIGHHPHLVQGIEIYRDSLIAPSIGNFMFDQEFARTQVSYVVKAWLEKGRFIRAEIVPITVLDYRPVPAVGRAREASLRRLFGLSAERGTELALSGGHAVVRPGEWSAEMACRTPAEEFRLRHFGPACLSGESTSTGRDIIARGSFDQATSFGAWERMFGAANAAIDFAGEPGGEHAMLRPERADRAIAFYTQGYLRDVPAGDYTLKARLRLPRAARIEFLAKERPARGVKSSARWRGELLGSKGLPASDNWQQVAFDFRRIADDEGKDAMARPFRPIIRIVWEDDQGTNLPVGLDDFSLVSWIGSPTPAQAWLATDVRPDGRISSPGLAAE